MIAYPQIEGYDKELSPVVTSDRIENAARYLAELKVISHGRQAIIYVRYYLTSENDLRIEQTLDDSIVAEEEERPDKPGLWQTSLNEAKHWGPTFVRLIMWLMMGSES